jgi:ribosome-associated protein
MVDVQLMELLRIAGQAAAEKKAFQIVCFEVSDITSYTDSILICSGASDRQVAAIVTAVQLQLKEAGRRPLHVEGERRADWVLLDYGEFVMHVFTEECRAYYGLDGLWGDAPKVDAVLLGIDEGDPQ